MSRSPTTAPGHGWRSVMAVCAVPLLATGMVACSATPATITTIPAPAGLPAFYSVPSPLPPGPPGTVLKTERVPAPGIQGTVYRVMYLSQSVQNEPVAVTGIVVAPAGAVPAGGFPVVSWGHGTNGMADQCAPSLNPSTDVALANALLQQRWVVTASDYQGEGTPGLLPYLVGEVAARNTIDIVRAARNMPAVHASDNYVVWGHSEGGQTAMFALDIASSYAPALHLQGVVAGAPPSQFDAIYQFLTTSPYRYYLYMAAAGFNAAYGDKQAPLAEVLTPKAISLLPLLSEKCAGDVGLEIDRYSLADMVKTNPFDVPAWEKLMQENDPASFTAPSPAPLLIIQGGADEQIPVVSTQLLAQHECAIGQHLQRWVYPGQSHAGVILPSMGDMIHWISAHLAGQAETGQYVPTGQSDIEVTSCP